MMRYSFVFRFPVVQRYKFKFNTMLQNIYKFFFWGYNVVEIIKYTVKYAELDNKSKDIFIDKLVQFELKKKLISSFQLQNFEFSGGGEFRKNINSLISSSQIKLDKLIQYLVESLLEGNSYYFLKLTDEEKKKIIQVKVERYVNDLLEFMVYRDLWMLIKNNSFNDLANIKFKIVEVPYEITTEKKNLLILDIENKNELDLFSLGKDLLNENVVDVLVNNKKFDEIDYQLTAKKGKLSENSFVLKEEVDKNLVLSADSELYETVLKQEFSLVELDSQPFMQLNKHSIVENLGKLETERFKDFKHVDNSNVIIDKVLSDKGADSSKVTVDRVLSDKGADSSKVTVDRVLNDKSADSSKVTVDEVLSDKGADSSKVTVDRVLNDKSADSSKVTVDRVLNDKSADSSKVTVDEVLSDKGVDSSKVTVDEVLNDKSADSSKVTVDEVLSDKRVELSIEIDEVLDEKSVENVKEEVNKIKEIEINPVILIQKFIDRLRVELFKEELKINVDKQIEILTEVRRNLSKFLEQKVKELQLESSFNFLENDYVELMTEKSFMSLESSVNEFNFSGLEEKSLESPNAEISGYKNKSFIDEITTEIDSQKVNYLETLLSEILQDTIYQMETLIPENYVRQRDEVESKIVLIEKNSYKQEAVKYKEVGEKQKEYTEKRKIVGSKENKKYTEKRKLVGDKEGRKYIQPRKEIVLREDKLIQPVVETDLKEEKLVQPVGEVRTTKPKHLRFYKRWRFKLGKAYDKIWLNPVKTKEYEIAEMRLEVMNSLYRNFMQILVTEPLTKELVLKSLQELINNTHISAEHELKGDIKNNPIEEPKAEFVYEYVDLVKAIKNEVEHLSLVNKSTLEQVMWKVLNDYKAKYIEPLTGKKYELAVEAKISFKAMLDFILFVEQIMYVNRFHFAANRAVYTIERMIKILEEWLYEAAPTEVPNDYWYLLRWYKWFAEGEKNKHLEDENLNGLEVLETIKNKMVEYFESRWGKRIVEYGADGMYIYSKDYSYIDRIRGKKHGYNKKLVDRDMMINEYGMSEKDLPYSVEEEKKMDGGGG